MTLGPPTTQRFTLLAYARETIHVPGSSVLEDPLTTMEHRLRPAHLTTRSSSRRLSPEDQRRHANGGQGWRLESHQERLGALLSCRAVGLVQSRSLQVGRFVPASHAEIPRHSCALPSMASRPRHWHKLHVISLRMASSCSLVDKTFYAKRDRSAHHALLQHMALGLRGSVVEIVRSREITLKRNARPVMSVKLSHMRELLLVVASCSGTAAE